MGLNFSQHLIGQRNVRFIIAGGYPAFLKAVENAEDNFGMAEKITSEKFINSHDVVIGLAASGNTPFTCKVMEEVCKK